MPLLSVGLDLRRMPPAVFERASFAAAELPASLARAGNHFSEIAILSTCMRVEIYAVADRFHPGVEALRSFLESSRGLAEDDLAGHLVGLGERRSTEHLFAVAAGLSSAVVGEPQILAQVRRAGRTARAEASAGPILIELFNRATQTGRRARAETTIGDGAASLAHAAVSLSAGAAGRNALVVGAGEMGSIAATELAARGFRVLICNRRYERAEALSATLGGRPVAWEELRAGLAVADFVVSSTSGAQPVITAADVRARGDRPLLIIDLAVPRDVEPAAGAVAGVTVVDLTGLAEAVPPSSEHLAGTAQARAIVAEETERFLVWRRIHAPADAAAFGLEGA